MTQSFSFSVSGKSGRRKMGLTTEMDSDVSKTSLLSRAESICMGVQAW